MRGDNPSVFASGDGFAIKYERRGGKVLYWIQDITKRSMKSAVVRRPLVVYETREQAEEAVVNDVIPHLLSEKNVEPDEIYGW